MRGKGTKLGEGIRDFYVRDYYHFWDSGFLCLGLFRLGKVRGTVNLLSNFYTGSAPGANFIKN